MTPEKGDAPGCLETEEGINLSDWARSVGERSYQVTHIYFFGSKIRGNPAKNDTDVFLLLEAPSLEERQELVGRIPTRSRTHRKSAAYQDYHVGTWGISLL